MKITKSSLEGQGVGHMERDVLVAFMRESGYVPISILNTGSIIFSNGNIKLATNQQGILHKVDGDDNGFNMKSYLEKIAKAPEGWEGTVKKMKKHKDEIDNPWALAHWMKGEGYESHEPEKEDKKPKVKETKEKKAESLPGMEITASSARTNEAFWCLMAGMPPQEVTKRYQLQPADIAEMDNMAVAAGGKSAADLSHRVTKKQLPQAYQQLWDKYHHDNNSGTMEPLPSPANPVKPVTTSGFNFKNYLQKHSFYEGTQGYWVAQSRAWANCTKCKQDAGKSAQEAWQECIDEYSGKKSNEEWAYQYASDVEDKMTKAAATEKSCPVCTTEKQLGDRKGKEPDILTEKQIEKDRKGEEEVTTEKQLGKVRTASAEQVTEGQIRGEREHDEPDTLTEKQIEKDRKGEEEVTTEKQLGKVRKEAQLDDSWIRSERSFQGAQRAHDNMTPPEHIDDDVEHKSTCFVKGNAWIKLAIETFEDADEAGRFGGGELTLCEGDGNLSNVTKTVTLYRGPWTDVEKRYSEKIREYKDAGFKQLIEESVDYILEENREEMAASVASSSVSMAKEATSHYRRQGEIGESGLCPICGVLCNVKGKTKDGRIVGNCGDAFTLDQWRRYDDGHGSPRRSLTTNAQQLQMGLYWDRIRQKQHEGLTPGQAVMAVLAEMKRDGDRIEVQAQSKRTTPNKAGGDLEAKITAGIEDLSKAINSFSFCLDSDVKNAMGEFQRVEISYSGSKKHAARMILTYLRNVEARLGKDSSHISKLTKSIEEDVFAFLATNPQ
jgi:hypothetical protein